MNVSLTPELEKYITEKVESGLYNSASEVIRQALRLLLKEDSEHEAKLQSLRSAIQEGLDSGEPVEWDMKSFKKKARKRLKSLQTSR